MAAAAILIWIATVVAPPFGPVHWWFLRGAVSILALLAACAILRQRNWTGLADPSFLMGAVVLVFYSLIPALAVQIAYGGPVPILPGDQSTVIRAPGFLFADEAAKRAVASSAELSVLRFSILCLGLASCLNVRRMGRSSPNWIRGWPGALALGVGVCLVNVSRRWDSIGPQSWLPGPIADQVLSFLPVVATTCLAILLLASLRRERRALISFASLAGLSFVSFLPFGGKAVTWALIVYLLILFQAASGRWKACFLVGILSIPILIPISIMSTREGAGQNISLQMVTTALWGKLVQRQSETVYCLAFAEKSYREHGASDHPGYFLAGLVPRFLWPDKPNLSQGGRYAHDFCGWPADEVAFARHSASITLLGEPLIRGGLLGLVIAQFTIIAILGIGSTALLSDRPGVAVAVLAIVPWLMDFDQHFALWLANIAKFLPVALLVSVALGGPALWRRPRERVFGT
jgi:hypothetical protein